MVTLFAPLFNKIHDMFFWTVALRRAEHLCEGGFRFGARSTHRRRQALECAIHRWRCYNAFRWTFQCHLCSLTSPIVWLHPLGTFCFMFVSNYFLMRVSFTFVSPSVDICFDSARERNCIREQSELSPGPNPLHAVIPKLYFFVYLIMALHHFLLSWVGRLREFFLFLNAVLKVD